MRGRETKQFQLFRTRQAGPPEGVEFKWLTKKGEWLELEDMDTRHIFYSLRLIFNHTVPEFYRTPESIHPVVLYYDAYFWADAYKKAACDALMAELLTRDLDMELSPSMQDGLRWMRMAARLLQEEIVFEHVNAVHINPVVANTYESWMAKFRQEYEDAILEPIQESGTGQTYRALV